MNTLLDTEKLISKSFSSNDLDLILTCNLFLFHFKTIDSVEHKSHLQAINLLYIMKNTKLTKQRIADEVFSNVKSLQHDRKLYADYFEYFYRYVKDNNFTAESAISFLR